MSRRSGNDSKGSMGGAQRHSFRNRQKLLNKHQNRGTRVQSGSKPHVFSDLLHPARTRRQHKYSTLGPLAQKPRRLKWLITPHPLRKLVLYLFILVVLSGGGLVFKAWEASRNIIVDGGGAVALGGDPDLSELRGEGDGRINVLLIGIGGKQHQAGDLADSIMLVSIDPVYKDVVTINIPRDLYVAIPGYGSTKINAAHVYGEQAKEGEGPQLLKRTISELLHIPIHYHIRLDFSGFREAINTVGGVDIIVKKAIYDYAYPGRNARHELFTITAGLHHMDGDTALKYSRSRYSTSDFDRSRRQQQVLNAFRDKALSVSTLLNPAKISGLLGDFSHHLQTNIQLGEFKRFIELVKAVGPTNVLNVNLNTEPGNFLGGGNVGGASVLLPNSGNFNNLRRYLFSIMTDGYIKRENASIRVLNATTNPGLAASVADVLRLHGYNVTEVANADNSSATSTLIYDGSQGKLPYTINYLEQRFGVSAQAAADPTQSAADVTIIVGNDYQIKD